MNRAFTPEPIVLGEHCLLYQGDYLKAHEASWLFDYCKGLAWTQTRIQLFGRTQLIPRLNCWIADPGLSYSYSNAKLQANPWHEPLRRLRAALERQLQQPFNNLLANYYRTGADSMGWHSDNELELGQAPVIVALSLGGERPLRFRPVGGGKSCDLVMSSGSLLVMPAGFQAHWQHCLPKRKLAEARISLTFRYINPSVIKM